MSEAVSFPPGTLSAANRTGAFGDALHDVAPSDAEMWVWLSYDQLNVAFLETIESKNVGVVLIESSEKANRRPYHQQKLGVLSLIHISSPRDYAASRMPSSA